MGMFRLKQVYGRTWINDVARYLASHAIFRTGDMDSTAANDMRNRFENNGGCAEIEN